MCIYINPEYWPEYSFKVDFMDVVKGGEKAKAALQILVKRCVFIAAFLSKA